MRDLTVGAAARLVRTAVSVSAALSLRNVVGVAVGAVVGGQRWSEILSQGVSPEISKITDTVEEGVAKRQRRIIHTAPRIVTPLGLGEGAGGRLVWWPKLFPQSKHDSAGSKHDSAGCRRRRCRRPQIQPWAAASPPPHRHSTHRHRHHRSTRGLRALPGHIRSNVHCLPLLPLINLTGL